MRVSFALYIACCCWFFPVKAQGQVANMLNAVGAVNQSMAGAATAMPLDASGSQYWNPASITDLEETEVDINGQGVFPVSTLSSSLSPNSISPGFPSTTLSGEVNNRSIFAFVPSINNVKKIENSRFSWGVLTTAISGVAVDFPHQGNNPITTPPPIGMGDIKSAVQSLQVAPTLAYKLKEHWSIGIQPNFDIASFKDRPFAGAKPADDNEDGIPAYPKTNRAWAVGIGIHGGVYYRRNGLHLGASIKSPQWFTKYDLAGTYENGVKRPIKTRLNVPMIVSVGVGYSAIPKVKLALDARYVDYANTASYDQVGFSNTGVLKGIGWKSIWALAAGAQYELNDRWSFRAGYGYNQVPVQPVYTSLSIPVPTIMRNQIAFGFSYRFNRRCTLVAAYHHAFANSTQGPFQGPNGPVPGYSVRLKSNLNGFVISLILKP